MEKNSMCQFFYLYFYYKENTIVFLCYPTSKIVINKPQNFNKTVFRLFLTCTISICNNQYIKNIFFCFVLKRLTFEHISCCLKPKWRKIRENIMEKIINIKYIYISIIISIIDLTLIFYFAN